MRDKVTERAKKKEGKKYVFWIQTGEQMETADEKLFKFTSVFLSLSTQFV